MVIYTYSWPRAWNKPALSTAMVGIVANGILDLRHNFHSPHANVYGNSLIGVERNILMFACYWGIIMYLSLAKSAKI